MGITVEAGSPSTATSGAASTVTTATFSPSANAVLAVITACNGTTAGATTITMSDSVGLTWNLLARSNAHATGIGGTAEVWYAFTATAQTNMTVTATGAGSPSNNIMLGVRVLDGAAPIQTNGSSATNGGASVTPQVSINLTILGSMPFMAVLEYSATTAYTATADSAVDASFSLGGTQRAGRIFLPSTDHTTQTTGTVSDFGLTNAASAWQLAAYEFIPVGTQDISMTPPAGRQAVKRASLW